MAAIKYKPLITGNKVTQYKGYSIVVGKTEEGDWLAETKRRIDNGTYSHDEIQNRYGSETVKRSKHAAIA